jgi:putative hydrolase of the HAD superfamily
MVLVFDLDNTLYPEISYVKSGFAEVAAYLKKRLGVDEKKIYKKMINILNTQGRGEVFDELLKFYNIYTKKEMRKCVSIYHLHKPEIKLYKAADRCLKRFKDYPIYIVTDGNKIVQDNKIKALGLEKRVKGVYITYRYGRKHSKPSTYCFELIAKKEKCRFNQITYVGDNPLKDFVNIKKKGFKTIRVLTGYHKNIRLKKEFEAEVAIKSLDDLSKKILF